MAFLTRNAAGTAQDAYLPPVWLAVALSPGLLLALWYAAEGRAAAGTFGFPLDDSWIHAQFARNLATGRGFTYTGGEWVAGSTAPVWTVLLAAGYVVTRQIVAAAYITGLACQFAAGYYAVRLTRLLDVPIAPALLAGTLVVTIPVMVWGGVSGMEVPLAAALVLAGLYHHFARRRPPGPRRHLGAALLGLSVLARPENLAVVAVVLLGEWFGREPIRERGRRFALGALVAALAAAPLFLFSYATIGRPLPTTFYAKSGPGIVRAIETRDVAMARRNLETFGPRAVHNFWLILVDQLSWTVWLGVAGLAAGVGRASTRRVSLTLLAALVVIPFAMGLTAPQRLKPDNVRYAAQLVVLAAPLIALAVWRVARRPRPAAAVLLVVSAIVAWRAVDQAALYAISVKNIQGLHVVTGRWLAAHLPAGSVVAVNDVGAIAYFSGHRILDLEGLVSPEVLPYRQYPDRGIRTVRDMRPDYVAIFPGWYPEIPASPDFQEIHRVTISDNMISAGDTMVIYQTPWTSPRRPQPDH